MNSSECVIKRTRWTARDRLSAALLAGFVGLAAILLYYEREHLTAIGLMSFGSLLGLVVLGGASLALLGFAQWILFRPVAPGLHVGESIQVAISLNFLNYLPAKAGFFGRGAYLHRVHSLAVNDYVGLTVRSRLIAVAVTSAIGSTVVFVVAPVDLDIAVWLASGLAMVAAVSMVTYLYGAWLITLMERLPLLRRLSQHLRYQKDPLGAPLVLAFAGLVTAAMLCRAARLYIIFSALGHPLGPATVIFIEAANVVIALLGLLPGNLGVREGAVGTFAAAFGVPWSVIVPAVLLDRLAMLVIPLALGPWFTYRLSKRMLSCGREAAH